MIGKNQKLLKENKVPKPFYKKWFVWVGLLGFIGTLPIVAFIVFIGYEYIFQLPKAKQLQTQLEIEFNTITPLPNASVVNYQSSHKTSNALVDSTYVTDVSPDSIFNYYDEQLKLHGWHYYGTTGMKDWGRDFGGKSAEYCKGDYVADIQYAGQQANYGWTYAFNVSWGLSGCR